MKRLSMIAALLLVACGKNEPPAPPATAAPMRAAPVARAANATNQPSGTLVNADFEQAAAEGSIPGWTMSQHAGPRSYEMRVDPADPYAGHASFHMTRTQPQVYGSLTQSLDAAAFAGKTVELSAMLKTHGVGPRGWGLFVSADVPGAMERSPGLTGDNGWTKETVRLNVPGNARNVTVGVSLRDAGDGWMDNVELKVVD
jgi:hypothetical protein